jgi:hypothetical protein
VLGLGGRGKVSDTPVLGGLKADSGNVGRDFKPFLRAPTPTAGVGETGGLGIVAMISNKALATLPF